MSNNNPVIEELLESMTVVIENEEGDKKLKFDNLQKELKTLYNSEIFKLNDEGNLSELSEILGNGIPQIAENQYALGEEQRKFTFESYPHFKEHFNQFPEIYNIDYHVLKALINMKEANIPFNILEDLTLQGGRVIVQSAPIVQPAPSGGRRVKRRRSKTIRKSKTKKLRKTSHTRKRKQSTRVK